MSAPMRSINSFGLEKGAAHILKILANDVQNLPSPSTNKEIWGKELRGRLCAVLSLENVSTCTRTALPKHTVKISRQEGLYCTERAECSSSSPAAAAGPGARGWHQHKDKNVMWGMSEATFKATSHRTVFIPTLPRFSAASDNRDVTTGWPFHLFLSQISHSQQCYAQTMPYQQNKTLSACSIYTGPPLAHICEVNQDGMTQGSVIQLFWWQIDVSLRPQTKMAEQVFLNAECHLANV